MNKHFYINIIIHNIMPKSVRPKEEELEQIVEKVKKLKVSKKPLDSIIFPSELEELSDIEENLDKDDILANIER